MENNDEKKILYKIAVEQVRHEANLSWYVFQTYIIVHTILVGFLLSNAFAKSLASPYGILIISAVGLFLCIPWRATSKRNSAYHHFRMAQARELEPEGWDFLKGKGKSFADGNEVEAGGEKHKITCLAQILRRPVAAKYIVYAFVLVYIITLFSSLINLPIFS
jgi:hypothetical protein